MEKVFPKLAEIKQKFAYRKPNPGLSKEEVNEINVEEVDKTLKSMSHNKAHLQKVRTNTLISNMLPQIGPISIFSTWLLANLSFIIVLPQLGRYSSGNMNFAVRSFLRREDICLAKNGENFKQYI